MGWVLGFLSVHETGGKGGRADAFVSLCCRLWVWCFRFLPAWLLPYDGLSITWIISQKKSIQLSSFLLHVAFFVVVVVVVRIFYHSSRNGARTLSYLVLTLAPGSRFGGRRGHSNDNATVGPGRVRSLYGSSLCVCDTCPWYS